MPHISTTMSTPTGPHPHLVIGNPASGINKKLGSLALAAEAARRADPDKPLRIVEVDPKAIGPDASRTFTYPEYVRHVLGDIDQD